MSQWSAAPIAEWILRRGRHLDDPQALLGGICDRVVAAGMPLARVRVFLLTLHPEYFGYVLNWNEGTTGIDYGSHSRIDTDVVRLSPMRRIAQGERVIRRRLYDPDCERDFPILDDLAAEGFTDYVLVELVFSTGTRNGVSLTTRAPHGFSDHDIAEVQQLLQVFALIMENHANRAIAATLMNTYLGSISGARVLEGKVKRGDGDYIDAVIWFSDLRESTALAERLGRAEFLELLNEYFEATAGAVLKRGGEVLRFIGDASLAVFPITDEREAGAICEHAIDAARDACQRVAEANTQRRRRGLAEFDFGIGLHRGEVLYGNIGTPGRLEFSVVGPAANETARIEGLCKTMGESVVVSNSVVQHLADVGQPSWQSLGHHALRGVRHEIEVFALPR